MRDFLLERFLLNLGLKDLLLNWIFEVGRHIFNPDLIWVTPSAASLSKDMEEGRLFFAYLLSP